MWTTGLPTFLVSSSLAILKFLGFLFIYLLYLFDTQRERAQVGKQADREGGGSRLPVEQRAQCGARSQDPETMTRAEGRAFNPLSHTGVPILKFPDPLMQEGI